jgi:hypothetical protein
MALPFLPLLTGASLMTACRWHDPLPCRKKQSRDVRQSKTAPNLFPRAAKAGYMFCPRVAFAARCRVRCMQGKSKSSIRMAVQGALVRCSQSPAPITALADFAEELISFGWSRETVEEIERRVLESMFGGTAESQFTATSSRWDDKLA